MNIPLRLLKSIISWLDERRTYVVFCENKPKIFNTRIGLSHDSSLSQYVFIVYHCDLIACVGIHSSHIFADDLNVFISPSIYPQIKSMIKLLEHKETKICNKITAYSKKWKQPVNLSKIVVQVFQSQIQDIIVNIYIWKINN